MISQALRCKLDLNYRSDIRHVPPIYVKATIPMLHDRADMLLKNVVGVDNISTGNQPTKPSPML